MMVLLGKKMKDQLAFRVGVIWYYLRQIENPTKFIEATEALATLAADLRLDWDAVQESTKLYEGICRMIESLEGFEIKFEKRGEKDNA